MQEILKWKLFEYKSCKIFEKRSGAKVQTSSTEQVDAGWRRAECEFEGSEEEVEVLAKPVRSNGSMVHPNVPGCVRGP